MTLTPSIQTSCTVILYDLHFPWTSYVCFVDHFNFDSIHCYFPVILCVACPFSFRSIIFSFEFHWKFSFVNPVGAPNGMRGFDCMSSDGGFCPEFKTDIGHKCGMYMWFVDLYIGTCDPCWHLTSDSVALYVGKFDRCWPSRSEFTGRRWRKIRNENKR